MNKSEEFMMELHDFKQIGDYERQTVAYTKEMEEIIKQLGVLSAEIHNKEIQYRFLEEHLRHVESLQIASSKHAQEIRNKALEKKS
ncbi:hypothetical protein LI951_14395 [Enterococcus sp. BWT-B8]|uniref:hypothetical protein n=1 Tax=Enterococcus sp. BWT-B8 TaxID=2885157 RepID=UPI001E350FD2|nr:hypothetical protein [Enterococcus sp. BWT-B8]MCB5953262.1 hypothetical protein [Enterococcus sp. BWT-B8]